jgi:trk system potassium uptake protein TrkA
VQKQIVVIGLGRFGMAVARTLYQMGNEVLAIDVDAALVQDIVEDVTNAVITDTTDPDALRELGVADFDTAVVAIGSNVQASILTTLNLRECGCRYIIAKATSTQQAKILERVGADRVVFPEQETGVRVAHTLSSQARLDYLDLGPGYGIAVTPIPEALAGKTLAEMKLEDRSKLSVIAIVGGDGVLLHPRPDEPIQAGAFLVVAGKSQDLQPFRV